MKPENWIKWDLDSRLGWRMAGFVFETGAGGYGAFIILIEMLYRSDQNRLPLDDHFMQTYANVCKCMQTDAKHLVASMVSHGLLVSDGSWVWSQRVLDEVGARKNTSELLSRKRQLAANIRWNPSKSNNSQAVDNMQTDASASCKMQVHANDARGEEIREEKKREEKREEKILPSVCVSPEIAGAREGPPLPKTPTATLGGVDPRALVKKLAATHTHSEPAKILAQEVPNGTHPKPQATPTMTRSERFAQNSLDQPDGSKDWERDNLYILAGRRPMKNFPLMWMTPVELKDVVDLYEKNGLTPEEVRGAIKSADARLKTGLVNGKPKNTISVFNWLIGWCLQEQLEIANSANKAKRSKSYEQPKYNR